MKKLSRHFLIGLLPVMALAQDPTGIMQRARRMSPDADPVFAVATIKLSDPALPGYGMKIRPGQFSATGYTLRLLVMYAWDLHRTQIRGGPAWLDSDKYNVTANPDGEGLPSPQQWKTMLQRLLADRFGLALHRETRTLSVYALTVAKGGPKLTPAAGDPNASADISFLALGRLGARNASMADFAHSMQKNVVDRPIVDRTNLSGTYDFGLIWVPDEFQFSEVRTPGGPQIPSNTDGADLFTAIQQQLGLKLTAVRTPAEVIVIDHAEKPTGN